MAPIAMFDALSSFSSAEVGIISLIIFLIVSISLVALCNDCQKGSGNAYDVNKGATTGDGKGKLSHEIQLFLHRVNYVFFFLTCLHSLANLQTRPIQRGGTIKTCLKVLWKDRSTLTKPLLTMLLYTNP
ncbi:uncharacterized protein LOC144010392 [Festucalex cinctus]